MRIYCNSVPVPLAVARSKFFEANPSRELSELAHIFGAATYTLGVGVSPYKVAQSRKVLNAFGLEVL
jgi:hypothetical protein